MFGTIARKKKTLNNLMDAISNVCEGKTKPKPNLVTYPKQIEDAIFSITTILKDFKVIPSNLLRWISLKILDGEEKILKGIEKAFNISIIDNEKIKVSRQEALDNLKSLNTTEDKFKDIIVSSIMNKAEDICKDVCSYENNNYSRKR